MTKLDKGMRYMPSALFNERLERKLRFLYPTEIFDEISFEVDNEGNPYWIVPTVKYKGIGIRKEIAGVIIFDPITGKANKYHGPVDIFIKERNKPVHLIDIKEPQKFIDVFNSLDSYIENPDEVKIL